MKLQILSTILMCTCMDAQILALNKVCQLPNDAPNLSIMHDDRFIFHASLTLGSSVYILDSTKASFTHFSDKPIINVVQRPNGGAVIYGADFRLSFSVVESLNGYLTQPNYRTISLDTLNNDNANLALGADPFDVDSSDFLYVAFNSNIGADPQNGIYSKYFVIKKVDLKSLKQTQKLFAHDAFGKINTSDFLKYDTAAKEICILNDNFFIRLDTHLNTISKVSHSHWRPLHTCIDRHSQIITMSNDTLYYLNKNLEVLKYFKIDLMGSALSQIKIDSKDRVYLKLYNHHAKTFTLYQVDFNTLVTQNSDTAFSAYDYVIQTSSNVFEVDTEAVDHITLHNMAGQVESYGQGTICSQLRGVVILGVYLKSGPVLFRKAYLGDIY